MMKIAWFLGPRSSSWNGVGQHSALLIRSLKGFERVTVDEISIPANARSIKRYLWQFLVYPFLAIRAACTSDLVVIYQEDMCHLIPFIRIAGGKACLIFHHVAVRNKVDGIVEYIKSIYLRLLQHIVSYANLVLVPSEATARDLVSYTNVQADTLRVVPCPFDNRYFDDSSGLGKYLAREFLKNKFGLDLGNKFVILNVGSDEGRKNNFALFDGVSRLNTLREISLIRVGEPINAENRKICKDFSRNSGVDAYFFDKVDDDDLKRFYLASDAYASPSLHEGFGRTVIEAQIAGLPVVASGLPVYRDNMGETFMSIDQPWDGGAWADALARLISDEELTAALVVSGQENAKRFSIEVVGEKLNQTFANFFGSARKDARLPG
ncbi:glycosyltransferase family 4 protein [Trinickia violacea]|uniref:Glycosyltransferase family 4 protein n=1 Tax=Trinickia violacea TaxID=2571746 RepID=A0A4P8J5I8_9BURK|nr:glycosyltransferase [Trinickia violacea]QCP54119.1 glycosyltransferase family 4 protein [Trinickia violacea]